MMNKTIQMLPNFQIELHLTNSYINMHQFHGWPFLSYAYRVEDKMLKKNLIVVSHIFYKTYNFKAIVLLVKR